MGFIEDIVAKGYGGYRGWGEKEAEADYKATGGQGKWDPGSSQQYAQQYNTQSQVTPSYQAPSIQPFEDMVAKAQEMYKKAAEPAIASLQAAQPEIKSSIASKTQLLNDRYNNIISDIKGGQQKAENRQTVVTAGELGKRGIDPTSTLYGQELANAVNPITGEYTGLLKSAATEQATGLQDLADLETTQLRNVATTIAQLQSGAGQQAISTALSLYQQAQTAAQNATTAAEQKRQNDIANAMAEKIYETVTLPQTQYNLNAPYYKPDSPVVNPYQQMVDLFGKDIVAGWFGGGNNTSDDSGFIPDPVNPYAPSPTPVPAPSR